MCHTVCGVRSGTNLHKPTTKSIFRKYLNVVQAFCMEIVLILFFFPPLLGMKKTLKFLQSSEALTSISGAYIHPSD